MSFSHDDISVYILNWKRVSANSLDLYNKIMPIIKNTKIINCDENLCLNISINHIQLDDSYYYGGQYNMAIKDVKKGNIFCIIVGDNKTESNFNDIFYRALKTFNNYNVGVYAPDDIHSPHRKNIYKEIDDGIFNIENTDCGFWFIHPMIVDRLRDIDYNLTRVGWGIDILTIKEAHLLKKLVLVDTKNSTDQLDLPPGYKGKEGLKGMNTIIKVWENLRSKNKIAFCFLIYDTINHEELWNLFFSKVNKEKYTIYIHYKENKPLKYFEEYKLQSCIKTSWNDISIVKAQNLLLETALKDDNTHFIFISNSCIPLKSFNTIYDFLLLGKSHFNKQVNPDDKRKRKYIKKASQWCILNKKHAELMTSSKEYCSWPVVTPDEYCYISNIYYNNLQHEILYTDNLSIGATTFTNWSHGMEYKYVSKFKLNSHPLEYKDISNEELECILNSDSLFGRKFMPECKDSLHNKKYILKITDNDKILLEN